MEKTRKAMLILNPISGTGKKQGVADKIRACLEKAGYEVDCRETTKKGDATEMAREAVDKGYAAVLAAGGDGTVNETARALCDTGVALGIIPLGSGNGLARHLEIPIDVDGALSVIAADHVDDCDYGTVNNAPFFCTFGVGLDAAVSYYFSQQSTRGFLRYLNGFFAEYAKYDPETYTISANGKILTERALVVTCCNASQYGNNAYIAPDASITDGLLDIIIIHQGSPIDAAIMGLDLFSGYINKNTLIQTLRAPAAVIYRRNAGPAHIDGDPTMLDDILDIKCRRRGLRIFTPAESHKFKPGVTPFNAFMQSLAKTFSNIFDKH